MLELLQLNWVLAAGLAPALGGTAGILNAFGMLGAFGGLLGAGIAALFERGLAGVKASLIIAAVCGLAWLIAQAMFAAGGAPPNIQMTPIG